MTCMWGGYNLSTILGEGVKKGLWEYGNMGSNNFYNKRMACMPCQTVNIYKWVGGMGGGIFSKWLKWTFPTTWVARPSFYPLSLYASRIEPMKYHCAVLDAIRVLLPVICCDHAEGFKDLSLLFGIMSILITPTENHIHLQYLTRRRDAHGVSMRDITA